MPVLPAQSIAATVLGDSNEMESCCCPHHKMCRRSGLCVSSLRTLLLLEEKKTGRLGELEMG